jgi:N-formylglutamate deformylase
MRSTSSSSHNLHHGTSPLLVSMPHIATRIPDELAGLYVPQALAVEDTDWHLDLLYNFLPALGASVLMPSVSRYVIDLNRPPDDTPMYPGAANTELCPTKLFTGEPLYQDGCAPDATAIAARREAYWQPYHSVLSAELARIKAIHGYALLWDAHSIRSHLPWLFEGKLPDINLGTADGKAAHASITAAVAAVCAAQGTESTVSTATPFTHVVNGRFKGGHITRQYGQPSNNVHAIQLEQCWSTYMQEQAPFTYDAAIAAKVQPLMQAMMQAALDAARDLYASA